MQVLVCKEPSEFEYIEEDYPVIKPGYSLLKLQAIGICGTDLHAYDGSQPFFQYPRVLGHEIAAKIIATEHPEFKVGQLVTFLPYFNCGHCFACQSGKENCCQELAVFGVHIDGGMKEFIQVPNQYLVDANGLKKEELALVEPYSIALHAVRRSGLVAEETAVIVGAGPIGIAAATFAFLSNAKVLVIDINEDRLELCRKMLPKVETCNARSGLLIEKVSEFSNGRMANVLFDATGNLDAIESSFSYLAHGGRFVLIGLQKGDISFNHPEFHKREATLMSSRNANRKDFEDVIAFMKTGELNFQDIITHRIPFNQLAEEFPNLINPENKVLKALVQFQ